MFVCMYGYMWTEPNDSKSLFTLAKRLIHSTIGSCQRSLLSLAWEWIVHKNYGIGIIGIASPNLSQTKSNPTAPKQIKLNVVPQQTNLSRGKKKMRTWLKVFYFILFFSVLFPINTSGNQIIMCHWKIESKHHLRLFQIKFHLHADEMTHRWFHIQQATSS